MSIAIDKVDAFKFPEVDPDPFHELDTPPTLLVPLVLMMDNDNKNPVDDKEATNNKAAILGSITTDGLRCSTQVPLPPCITKVSFNNKSYSVGICKDGTMHITVGAGQDNNHPSPINPDPYMHVLGVAILHCSIQTSLVPPSPNPTVSKPGSRNLTKLVRRLQLQSSLNSTTTQPTILFTQAPSPPKTIERPFLPS